jgi:hypothetical protein
MTHYTSRAFLLAGHAGRGARIPDVCSSARLDAAGWAAQRHNPAFGRFQTPSPTLPQGFPPFRHTSGSTKTPFEIHTGCCRVRRKRKRLTSNDRFETDAAVRRFPNPKCICRVTSDRDLTFCGM